MESILEPTLVLSAGLHSQMPKGNQCQHIAELVDGAAGLEEEDKEACRQAIRYLQVGFDELFTEDEEPYSRYHMIFSWIMLSPPEFTSLLAARKPEALALLGYYSLMLHYGRNMWQVGSAGAYILSMISDHLGPDWYHWLEYPRQVVARDCDNQY